MRMPLQPDPILIAGPTASGKSALALALAQQTGGCIINADALQVYRCWRVLSARPSAEEEAQAPHFLYGHIDCDVAYSTGQWLREVAPCLADAKKKGRRPIIVGGTGLYFSALTEGLAEIPPTSEAIRAEGNHILSVQGVTPFLDYLQLHDAESLSQIDTQNPVRVQRAWEVHRNTGIGLTDWHRRTPPPLLEKAAATRLVMDCDRDWLAERIDWRFGMMMEQGALAEVEAVLERGWNPLLPSAQAIGARELVAHLQGDLELDSAISNARTQSRQYAKRQRTWFRNRMQGWQKVSAENGTASIVKSLGLPDTEH